MRGHTNPEFDFLWLNSGPFILHRIYFSQLESFKFPSVEEKSSVLIYSEAELL